MSLSKKLGLRIRTARLKLGLSQEGLAERAELHRTYIGMVERGERNLTLVNLGRICTGLRITISELTKGIDE